MEREPGRKKGKGNCDYNVIYEIILIVKNKFLFVLCLFDTSTLDMLDHMWVGVHGQEIGQDLHLPLIGYRWEVHRQEVHGPLIEPDMKYGGPVVLPF